MAISPQVSPDSLSDVSAGNFQRALINNQELLELRWGRRVNHKMVEVHGTI
jgi:hypothetical protein